MKNIIIMLIALFVLAGCSVNSNNDRNKIMKEKQEIKIKNIVKNQNNKTGVLNNENIKKAFLKQYPKWDKNLIISIDKISTSKYAMGTIIKQKHNSRGFWFAAKVNNEWIIIDHMGGSYFGICQNFKKYNFPLNMTPDCWDEEKNVMIETANYKKFFKGLTKNDREALKQAVIDYSRDNNYVIISMKCLSR